MRQFPPHSLLEGLRLMVLKRLCGLLLFGALFCSDVPAQEAAAPAAAAKTFATPVGKLDLKDGDSIVFLGDSITHQRLYTQYLEDFFYTRFPKMRLKIHNAGVGGARALDALDRFDKDVAAYKPKYVTILLGMNDGSYQSYNEEVFLTYQRDMTKVLDKIAEIGAVAVPMTPTMFDTRALRMKSTDTKRIENARLYNSVLAYFGGWLQEQSYERGLGFVDMYSPLNQITIEERKTDPTFTLIADAVHPGADGQVVMAVAVIDDLGLKSPVSSTNLNLNPNGKWTGRAQGGKVTDIEGDANHLTFTLNAESLPWVLPPSAQLGVKLTKLGHQFSREALQINGLAPGKYTLTIDGVDVGTFSANQLAGHIELQANEKTPQYQQALKVAELNKQRNEGPIGALRGEWQKFQQYSRVKRGNADAGTIAKLEEQQKGMDERVAAANAAALALEDEIFKVNQPQPRKYELTAVK